MNLETINPIPMANSPRSRSLYANDGFAHRSPWAINHIDVWSWRDEVGIMWIVSAKELGELYSMNIIPPRSTPLDRKAIFGH